MKKLFLLFAVTLLTTTVMAEVVHVQFRNGKMMEGLLISYDEDVLVIEPNTLIKYEKRIVPSEIDYFEIEGVGKCKSTNGKFVFDESTRVSHATPTSVTEVPIVKSTQPSTPNEVIGKAFKSTGSVCMAAGVPSLIVGTILVAYERSTMNPMPKTLEEARENEKKGNIAIAGYVLMPMGAALTIVGIPLYVHGKRIAELNFNYTGNGAGLALKF